MFFSLLFPRRIPARGRRRRPAPFSRTYGKKKNCRWCGRKKTENRAVKKGLIFVPFGMIIIFPLLNRACSRLQSMWPMGRGGPCAPMNCCRFSLPRGGCRRSSGRRPGVGGNPFSPLLFIGGRQREFRKDGQRILD